MGNNLTANKDGSLLDWVANKRYNNLRRWRSASLPQPQVTAPSDRVSPEEGQLHDFQEGHSTRGLRSAMKRPSQPINSLKRVVSLKVPDPSPVAASPTVSGCSGSSSPRVTFAPNLPGFDEETKRSEVGVLEAGLVSMSVSVGSLDSYKEFDEYFEKAERELLVSSEFPRGERKVRQRSASFTKADDETKPTGDSTSVQRERSIHSQDNDTSKSRPKGAKEDPLKDNNRKSQASNFNRKRSGSVAVEQLEPHLRHCLSTGELRKQSLIQRRQHNASVASKMSFSSGRKKKPSEGPKGEILSRKLTGPQIHLIRQAWHQLSTTKGPTVLGTAVLQRLFFKAPLIKDSFLRSPITQKEFTNHDKLLKEHARLVSGAIDTLVKNLEDLDGMSPMLITIGKQHAHLSEYGFTPKFWNVFAEAFIDCTLEWGEKNKRGEETWKAWALIASYMIEKIKLGYIEERRVRATSQPGSSGGSPPETRPPRTIST